MSEIDDTAIDWVALHARGALSPADQAAFEAWYDADIRHQGAYLRAQGLWESLERTRVPAEWVDGDRPVEARPPLFGQSPAPNRPALNRRRLLLGGGGLAASVAVGVVAVLGRPTVLTTAHGELRKVPLPDRSVANLNTDSHVEVEVTAKARHIRLVRGEAWFDVAKDPQKPFIVAVDDIRVQALGTAFSVRRFASGVEIMVTEGTVEAWSDTDAAARKRLGAGEAAFVAAATHAISTAVNPNIESRLAWRDGNIVLQNDTLADAAAEFNRYNAQKIVVSDPSLLDRRFVGVYSLDKPGEFADAVKTLTGAKLSSTVNNIIIGSDKNSN